MDRIDFHNVDFTKMEILDNYNYHSDDYHAYHLVFALSEFPQRKLLVVIDIWGNDWNLKPIHQLEPKIDYILDNELKEKFIIALKEILAIA